MARARDFGDLSENAEYHAAKEELSFLEGRVEELEDIISKATASEAQTVSAATEEQSATMEEIAASSQVLAKIADELNQAVRKFKT